MNFKREELIAQLREAKGMAISIAERKMLNAAADMLKADAQDVPFEPVAYSLGNTLHWHVGKGLTNVQLYAVPPPQIDELRSENVKRRATLEEALQVCKKLYAGAHDPMFYGNYNGGVSACDDAIRELLNMREAVPLPDNAKRK